MENAKKPSMWTPYSSIHNGEAIHRVINLINETKQNLKFKTTHITTTTNQMEKGKIAMLKTKAIEGYLKVLQLEWVNRVKTRRLGVIEWAMGMVELLSLKLAKLLIRGTSTFALFYLYNWKLNKKTWIMDELRLSRRWETMHKFGGGATLPNLYLRRWKWKKMW